MMMMNYKDMPVGEIVAENIELATVFQSYGIDFCCGGDVVLEEACKNASAPLDKVIKALQNVSRGTIAQAVDFNTWPLDLLIDYITKFQHHYIRSNGTRILTLLNKVCNAHGETDIHLFQVRDLFQNALIDLGNHLDKEEKILFPYVTELLNTQATGEPMPIFHCGSIENPIRAMMQEHDDEGERFRTISKLTNSYAIPANACNSYKLLLQDLKTFEANLHIHIHVENNILFAKSIALQEEVIG